MRFTHLGDIFAVKLLVDLAMAVPGDDVDAGLGGDVRPDTRPAP
jgi:hypothetical protein